MFIVVGNHGIGKNTFLSRLAAEEPTMHTAPDLHDPQWLQQATHSLYSHMADNDPRRWVLEREVTRLRCYAYQESNANAQALSVVTKHSIHIQRYVFAYNAYLQGCMEDVEWSVYEHTYNELSKRCSLPHGIIYLYTEPDVVCEHLPEDDQLRDVTREYMTQIHNRYEDLLMYKVHEASALRRVPTIMIDYNQAVCGDTKAVEHTIYEARRFIAATNRCCNDQTMKASTV